MNRPTYNPKDKMLSPEAIEVGTIYSFTVNPNDKRQYWELMDRVEKLTHFMELQLIDIPNVHIMLHMEISRTGRLHFHGTIKFTTKECIKHFFLFKIYDWMKLHQLDMGVINDSKIWDDYCTKSKSILDVKITTKECMDKYRKVKVDKNGVAHKPFF